MSEKQIDLSGDNRVFKKVISEGVGDETPSNGCKVSLHYTGRFPNGNVFDSSVERKEPFEFQLGKGAVIKAFDMGVASMKKGEKCELTCAPEYAYGEAGSPPSIPGNSTLIFDLELLDWKGEDLSPNKDGSIERFVIKKSDKRKTPNDGAHVKIHIIGKHEGRIFEERDVEFDVGEGSECKIIEGIEVALLKVSVGETARLIIKPKYAFGSEGNSEFGIPPNATIEYLVTLNECEKAIDEWKLDKDESLEQAKIFKEKGNNYLKKGNFKLAIKMYNKSNNYLSNCDNDDSKQTKVAVYLNIALCNQKMGEYFDAKTACNTALQNDSKNIKALYRRGQCHLSINDFEKALEDFQQVKELDPENKAVINQIIICKQKIKEFHDKEKKVYANMFMKFAATDKQKETTSRDDEPDVLSSCGEWTEEEAIRQVDRAFERDSNIVMLN